MHWKPKIALLYNCVPVVALCFLNLPVSCQFKFSAFFNAKYFLYIKMSWRKITFNYPLHVKVDNLIAFPPNWVILVTSLLKSSQFLEIDHELWLLHQNLSYSECAVLKHLEVLATLRYGNYYFWILSNLCLSAKQDLHEWNSK